MVMRGVCMLQGLHSGDSECFCSHGSVMMMTCMPARQALALHQVRQQQNQHWMLA